jgi:hypothetical protein
LRIIDFDLAIHVEDKNTEIDEYSGTEEWTVPEMGKEDGQTPIHGPIKADRWLCSRFILRHIMVGTAEHRLLKFADQPVDGERSSGATCAGGMIQVLRATIVLCGHRT